MELLYNIEKKDNYKKYYNFKLNNKSLLWQNVIKLFNNMFFIDKLTNIIKQDNENYHLEFPMINNDNIDTKLFEFVIIENVNINDCSNNDFKRFFTNLEYNVILSKNNSTLIVPVSYDCLYVNFFDFLNKAEIDQIRDMFYKMYNMIYKKLKDGENIAMNTYNNWITLNDCINGFYK